MKTLRRFEKFLTFFLRKISMYSKLLAFVIQSRECSFSSPAPPGDLSTQEALGTRIVASWETLGQSVGRVGRKAKEPLGTDSHRAISKNSSGCRLLIGDKKCFVFFCPISEQFLLSSFREFIHDGRSLSNIIFDRPLTTAIVSITDCLAHAPKKCTESGNFQFDIKSLSDFKILSARKIKTLFQKYKLELTTGIRACIDHAFASIWEFNMP